MSPLVFATIVHLSGLGFMILAATMVHAPIPSKHALTWSLVAGTAGGLALAMFYGSLSSGKMGLAAPVAGVLSAGIPAIATMFRQGSPGTSRLIGFALATLGVWSISRSDDKTERKVLGTSHGINAGTAYFLLNGGAPSSSQEYMQPITDSARGMVNTVYDSLLNGKK